MKNVYVVRHCKAEGQEPDAKLTELGIRQAMSVAEFLSGREIDIIYSSPFERARRTIAPFAEMLGIEVVIEGRLSERVLCGTDAQEWREMLRQTYDDLDLCFEGGESSRRATSRAVSVIEEALSTDNKNLVVVSHGNLISLMLMFYEDQYGFKEWEAMSNPDVFHLAFAEGKVTVRRLWTEAE